MSPFRTAALDDVVKHVSADRLTRDDLPSETSSCTERRALHKPGAACGEGFEAELGHAVADGWGTEPASPPRQLALLDIEDGA